MPHQFTFGVRTWWVGRFRCHRLSGAPMFTYAPRNNSLFCMNVWWFILHWESQQVIIFIMVHATDNLTKYSLWAKLGKQYYASTLTSINWQVYLSNMCVEMIARFHLRNPVAGLGIRCFSGSYESFATATLSLIGELTSFRVEQVPCRQISSSSFSNFAPPVVLMLCDYLHPLALSSVRMWGR